ncbi:MAG: hypothetical protein B7X65_23455 [Polaromonas sp. 39-63-25]|nr:MAG: hypothetical protein B7X65_23455 [Polaromonas sp. 39-63-25]
MAEADQIVCTAAQAETSSTAAVMLTTPIPGLSPLSAWMVMTILTVVRATTGYLVVPEKTSFWEATGMILCTVIFRTLGLSLARKTTIFSMAEMAATFCMGTGGTIRSVVERVSIIYLEAPATICSTGVKVGTPWTEGLAMMFLSSAQKTSLSARKEMTHI